MIKSTGTSTNTISNAIAHKIIIALFMLYMYGLLKVILFKFHSIDTAFLLGQLHMKMENPHYLIERLQQGNLVPFKEITESLNNLSTHSLINIVGNIVLFMPLGIFLSLMSKNNKLTYRVVIIRSFAISLCLESAQLLFSIGSFDVDDLILNSFGGVSGYAVFQLLWKQDNTGKQNE